MILRVVISWEPNYPCQISIQTAIQTAFSPKIGVFNTHISPGNFLSSLNSKQVDIYWWSRLLHISSSSSSISTCLILWSEFPRGCIVGWPWQSVKEWVWPLKEKTNLSWLQKNNVSNSEETPWLVRNSLKWTLSHTEAGVASQRQIFSQPIKLTDS